MHHLGLLLSTPTPRERLLRRWQIWGESNNRRNFLPNRVNGPDGPRAYARILDAGYVALKRVSRRNVVIGGMTFSAGDVKPVDFLRWMRLPSGRRPRLDWFAHNPFPFGFPDLRKATGEGVYRDMSDVGVFAEEVARAYRRRRPPKLWLSEFTVQSDHSSTVFELSVSRAAQARWLRAAYEIADSLPAIAGLGWFSPYDQGDSPTSANWGLLSAPGERKPSYLAYRRAPAGGAGGRAPARGREGRRRAARVRRAAGAARRARGRRGPSGAAAARPATAAPRALCGRRGRASAGAATACSRHP